MNWVVILYDACAAFTLLYALSSGGRWEKAGAALNAAASALSIVAVTPDLHMAFRHPEIALFAMDALAATGFFALMVASRSFWPVWAFAFAAAGPAVTAARLLTPQVPAIAYYATEGMWAYGTMAAIVIGTAARARPWMVLRL